MSDFQVDCQSVCVIGSFSFFFELFPVSFVKVAEKPTISNNKERNNQIVLIRQRDFILSIDHLPICPFPIARFLIYENPARIDLIFNFNKFQPIPNVRIDYKSGECDV